MKKEKTLMMILPSCMRYAEWVENEITKKTDMRIVKSTEIRLSGKDAEKFCHNHESKLINVISSGKVKAYYLEGKNAISQLQTLLGPEDPNSPEAQWWQLRCKFADGAAYANGSHDNGFYCSDSVENAKRDINFIFEMKNGTLPPSK